MASPDAIKDPNSNLWKIYRERLQYFRDKLTNAQGGNFQNRSCGIEWDNVDLYDSIGLGMVEGKKFLDRLRKITEDQGFVFALKNSVDILPQLDDRYELFINEEAQQWNEIEAYKEVGKKFPVLNVEYKRPRGSPDYVTTHYYHSMERIDGKGFTVIG